MLSFVQKTILILRKSTKLCASTADLLVQDAPNHLYAAGFVPFPLTTPPDPQLVQGKGVGRKEEGKGEREWRRGREWKWLKGSRLSFLNILMLL